MRPEPKVRGEALLRALETVLLRAESALGRVVPDSKNPLLHTGAIANVLLLVAIATGGLLLFWYSPSVHFAYESMQAIEASVLPSVVRSVHRYSSDACMLFALLHFLRLSAARRFTGARWLAWVTGLAALALLWLVGWVGYWLVWDEPARQVATATARFLDGLPVFSDKLESAFLTDAGASSLLFFVVFFVHMLIPLLIGVALWLHIARLARPRFLTPLRMSMGMTLALVVLALLVPAKVGARAALDLFPAELVVDAWYLLPLVVTERSSTALQWSALVVVGLVLLVGPWLSTRKRAAPATIVGSRCHGCRNCVEDCPYEAIELVPRTDGRPFPGVALVDPSRCVGCGICNGSCATAGSGLPSFDTLAQRKVAEDWLDAAPAGEKPAIAYLCDDAIPDDVVLDEASGRAPAFPGYRVMRVPCAGWAHAITVERLLRKGAPSVLVAGCAGSCRYREGMGWAEGRMAGEHETPLAERVDRARVRVVAARRTALPELVAEARALLEKAPPRPKHAPSGRVGAALVALGIAVITWAGSFVPVSMVVPESPRLAVAFKHPGVVTEVCRELSPEELAKLPAHMRRPKECQRGRQPVRLRLSIDGAPRLERAYAPTGLWGDGSSVVLEELDAPSGRHRVEVGIAEVEGDWKYVDARELDFARGQRRAVLFDRTAGFTWR